jgi:hypothetical protein
VVTERSKSVLLGVGFMARQHPLEALINYMMEYPEDAIFWFLLLIVAGSLAAAFGMDTPMGDVFRALESMHELIGVASFIAFACLLVRAVNWLDSNKGYERGRA